MSSFALINSPNAPSKYSITNLEVGLALPQITGAAETSFDLINTAAGAEIPLIVPAGTYIVSMKCVIQTTVSITAKLQFAKLVLTTAAGVVISGHTQNFAKGGAGTDNVNIDVYFSHQERLVVPVETTYFMRMLYCGSSNIFPFNLTGDLDPTLAFTPTF